MEVWKIHDRVQDSPLGVRLVDIAEDCAVIRQSDCAVSVWQRRPLPSFQSWIDGLAPETLPTARVILRPEGVRTAVRQICVSAGTPDCVERDLLIDDVAAMADIFAKLMQAQWLRLRLDLITTNACKKFHVDAVTARLVCTYRGTGTQYGNTEGGRDPKSIFTVPTGSPILLRGTRWPEQPPSGVRHRSPPIEGSGETRLVLVLDPITEPEEEI